MKSPTTETLLVPMAEAVTFTGLSERTLWRLVQKRKVPHVRIGGRLMFRRESLAKWVQDQEVQR